MAYIQVYQDRRKAYRWQVRASDGDILAVSTDGYADLGALWKGVSSVSKALGASLDGPIPIHPRKPK